MKSVKAPIGLIRASALGVCALLAFAAAAFASGFGSTVKITSGVGTEFKGFVHSSKGFCERHRYVTLYRTGAKAPVKVAYDYTNKQGDFDMHGTFLSGRFFAQASKKTHGDDFCKASVSATKHY